jgi:hypothetical protein
VVDNTESSFLNRHNRKVVKLEMEAITARIEDEYELEAERKRELLSHTGIAEDDLSKVHNRARRWSFSIVAALTVLRNAL